MAEKDTYKLLFIGDVCGRPGRKMLEDNLAKIQWDEDIDFTIVNGENSSGGRGMNSRTLNFFKDLGVDAVTMGNHTWDNKEIFNYLDREKLIARPLNYGKGLPGVGYVILPMVDLKVAVVNVICRTYMNNVVADCPFQAVEDALPLLREQADVIFVDVHGEATSEKIALGRFLDGKVSAVIGTHTHVQTNDARILPKGTAYLTDAGMTGPRDSILGMEIEPIVEKFRTGRPFRFQVADGDLQINGVIVTVNAGGTAKDIKLINYYQGSF
ncbi:MAG: TIGR00282 family metallophosphoesterase [Bacillota bacterium]|jgi:metallophosphoesterase (TIGR00282 family)